MRMTVRLIDIRRHGLAPIVAGAAMLALAQPGMAADDVACDLAPGGTAAVTEVIDGDTVVLQDGRQVRLVGIQAPKLALGRSGFEEWPLAAEAKAALETLVLGKAVRLGYGGERMDRHGRVLAQLHIGGGDATMWVQGAMVTEGLARAYSFADNRPCARELLALEGAARDKALGIWRLPYYAIRSAAEPSELERLADTFQIVEGKVRAVALVRGRVYINFGENYRTDFTASIDPRDVGNFPKRGRDLKVLEGRTVRVRGWLGRLNGPVIEVSHPEQIELLGAGEQLGG